MDSTSPPWLSVVAGRAAGSSAGASGSESSSELSSVSSSTRSSMSSISTSVRGRGILLPGSTAPGERETAVFPAAGNAGNARDVPGRPKENAGEKEGPKRPLVPRRRGAAFSTQPLGSLLASLEVDARVIVGPGFRACQPIDAEERRPIRRALLGSEHLATEGDREDRAELFDRVHLHRIGVVGGEVGVRAGREAALLLLLVGEVRAPPREQADRFHATQPLS